MKKIRINARFANSEQHAATRIYFSTPIRAFLTTALLFAISAAALPNAGRRIVSAHQTEIPTFDNRQTAPEISRNYGKTPIYFEENRGQQPEQVRFIARGAGSTLFLTRAAEAVFAMRNAECGMRNEEESSSRKPQCKGAAVWMKLAGAKSTPETVGEEELPGKINYFRGNDSRRWQTNVPIFARARMNEVYPGVALEWYGRGAGDIEYDFRVAPDADATQIEWQIEGASDVNLDAAGNLLIETEAGTLKQHAPVTYQETNGFRQEIQSRWSIPPETTNKERRTTNKFRVKFEVGNYDRSKTLVIDPTVNLSNLAYSTLLGAEAVDHARGIAVDAAGNTYVTGSTTSLLFPTTPGVFDVSHTNEAIFITKLNAFGSGLIYSTYLDGNSNDSGQDIAVDVSGNAYVTGFTLSTDFPTFSSFSNSNNGSMDALLTKLNPTGSALLYSTYLGSGGIDHGLNIALDSAGNAFITGMTASVGFPTTAGAFDTTHNGGRDAFICKINPTLSGAPSLVYSTFLGGTADEINLTSTSGDIAVDSAGNAYVTGDTTSADFPTTAGVFDTTQNGGSDVYVAKLNAGGTALVYSTFIGGNLLDEGRGIAVDPAGNAYVTGTTTSSGYPTTGSAFDTSHNGLEDVFVTKLNAAATAPLVYSTFIGGNGSDISFDIALDSNGNAYLTGSTTDATADYPTTAGAFDGSHNGADDVFLSKLSNVGSTLVYSTFIGSAGAVDESGNRIAVDANGNAYLTGEAETPLTTTFPTTSEAFQTTYNGGQTDSFVAKFGDFAIAGRTLDAAGLPLGNTLVTMSGALGGFMMTDSQGFFGFTDTVSNGSFTVAATRSNYGFNPPNFQVGNLNRNQEIFFGGRLTAGPTAAPAALGGDVTSTAGNVPLPNTTLFLVDTVDPSESRVTTTDARGNYNFGDVQTGKYYVVYAIRDGYNFAPGTYAVAHFDENLSLDFTAAPAAPRPTHDFDGDGKSDLSVFRPENGTWYVLNSQDNRFQATQFGVAGDLPVPADYDGDRRTDFAIYRPSEGVWYLLQSTAGFRAVKFGISSDKAVPADYDGDEKADIAVYRPENGVWYRLNSTDGQFIAERFGAAEDKPAVGDFDGDGRADIAVYRPSNSFWYRLNSSDRKFVAQQFGISEDKPVAADFDGDGKTDVAVYRPTAGDWYWLKSSDGEFAARHWGIASDAPVPADYDGDGRFEPAVFRGGVWHILRSGANSYSAQFGQTGDIPTSASNDW